MARCQWNLSTMPSSELLSGLLAQVLKSRRDTSLAAAAIAAAKDALSVGSQGRVSVTETRRFAGKDIQVMHR